MNEQMLGIKNITKLEPNNVYAVDFNSNVITLENLVKYLGSLNE